MTTLTTGAIGSYKQNDWLALLYDMIWVWLAAIGQTPKFPLSELLSLVSTKHHLVPADSRAA